jgi:hypothetical protein
MIEKLKDQSKKFLPIMDDKINKSLSQIIDTELTEKPYFKYFLILLIHDNTF